MPELPEVETMRRGILGVVGSRIPAVGREPCKLRPIEVRPQLAAFRKRTVGQTILAVPREGDIPTELTGLERFRVAGGEIERHVFA